MRRLHKKTYTHKQITAVRMKKYKIREMWIVTGYVPKMQNVCDWFKLFCLERNGILTIILELSVDVNQR